PRGSPPWRRIPASRRSLAPRRSPGSRGARRPRSPRPGGAAPAPSTPSCGSPRRRLRDRRRARTGPRAPGRRSPGPPARAPATDRIAVAGPLLADPLRAVLVAAVFALSGVPQDRLNFEERKAWPRAADDYIATQKYHADRPEGATNLGTFYARLGRFDEAQA